MTAPSPLTVLCDQLEQLRAEATPGEWTAEQNYIDMGVPDNSKTLRNANGWALGDVYLRLPGEDNAALIVAAVNAVPRLTAAIRAVEALAGEWEARGELALLASRAPGTNLGQHWHGMEIAAETKSYADAIRAALATVAGS